MSAREHDDGGPAFPWGEHGTRLGGMSLRDWFAGQALVGFLSDGSQRLVAEAIKQHPDGHLIQDSIALAGAVNEQIASGCYALADALLTERTRSKGDAK